MTALKRCFEVQFCQTTYPFFDSYYSEEDEVAILIVESGEFSEVGEGEAIPFY